MDMDMDGSSTSTSGMSMSMKNYFHGTLGDPLWFASWASTAAGSFFAACLVLFVLAVIERFLAAVRGMSDTRWRAASQHLLSSTPRAPFYLSPSSSFEKGLTAPSTRPSLSSAEGQQSSTSTSHNPEPAARPTTRPTTRPSPLDMLPHRNSRWAPPFVWRIDLLRGLLRALQTGVRYLLMLGVMSFNVYFFVAVVAGEGVGEVLFGRFCSTDEDHH